MIKFPNKKKTEGVTGVTILMTDDQFSIHLYFICHCRTVVSVSWDKFWVWALSLTYQYHTSVGTSLAHTVDTVHWPCDRPPRPDTDHTSDHSPLRRFYHHILQVIQKVDVLILSVRSICMVIHAGNADKHTVVSFFSTVFASSNGRNNSTEIMCKPFVHHTKFM